MAVDLLKAALLFTSGFFIGATLDWWLRLLF